MVKTETAELNGEVFDLNGRVAGSVPACGIEGAIPFQVVTRWPGDATSPSWVDVLIAGRIKTRLNPAICEAPYFRLFDVVCRVSQNEKQILTLKNNTAAGTVLGGTSYLFSQWNGLILVDSSERAKQWESKYIAAE